MEGHFLALKSNKVYTSNLTDCNKILCLDRSRPLRPRTCKEEEGEESLKLPIITRIPTVSSKEGQEKVRITNNNLRLFDYCARNGHLGDL
jgi:hypothetical protein